MKADNPAFPVEDARGNIYSGISIRDHIAIQAMQAFISCHTTKLDLDVCKASYEVADAMIAQSEKSE